MGIKRVIELIRLDFHQYKQGIKVLLPVMLLILSIKLLPRYLQRLENNKYTIRHEAILREVEIKKGIQESELGGRVVNKKFIIDYEYELEGKPYKGQTIYLREELTITERRGIEQMKEGDRIEIWLKRGNEEQSKYKTKEK